MARRNAIEGAESRGESAGRKVLCQCLTAGTARPTRGHRAHHAGPPLRGGARWLHSRLRCFMQDLDDSIELLVGGHVGRCEEKYVAAQPGEEAPRFRFGMQARADSLLGWKLLLRHLVLNEFHGAHHALALDVALAADPHMSALMRRTVVERVNQTSAVAAQELRLCGWHGGPPWTFRMLRTRGDIAATIVVRWCPASA